MPSVGIRSVGAVKDLSIAASSLAAIFVVQSMLRSRVLKRLVSSTTGAGSASANSAYSIHAPYFPSATGCMTLALPCQLFSISSWYSETTTGIGSQTRATPLGRTTSTRVVISKVRQGPGRGLNSFCWALASERNIGKCDAATTADAVADASRNVRRFIGAASSWMVSVERAAVPSSSISLRATRELYSRHAQNSIRRSAKDGRNVINRQQRFSTRQFIAPTNARSARRQPEGCRSAGNEVERSTLTRCPPAAGLGWDRLNMVELWGWPIADDKRRRGCPKACDSVPTACGG